jgi:hypothetical protein
MFLLNNIKVSESVQRTIGDVQYPAGWFSNADERAKVGMIEVADPVRPDDNLFIVVENPDGSYTSTPRSDEDIAAYNANKDLEQANSVRQTRNYKLKECDWIVIKNLELNANIPGAWEVYRQALRDIPAQSGFPWTITWPTQP